jgi:hypothetical protein
MKNLNRSKLIATTILSLFTACSWEVTSSSKVDQDEIYQSYSVHYDESTNELRAVAQLQISGSMGNSLDLAGQSEVRFNHHAMQKEQILGVQYVYSEHEFRSINSWMFRDLNGKVYNNSAEIFRIIIDTVDPVVEKATGFTVRFSGQALHTGESIQVVFQGPQSDFHYNGVAHGNTVTVSPAELAQTPPGTGTIYLIRNGRPAIQQKTTHGGHITVSYASTRRGIEIR